LTEQKPCGILVGGRRLPPTVSQRIVVIQPAGYTTGQDYPTVTGAWVKIKARKGVFKDEPTAKTLFDLGVGEASISARFQYHKLSNT